MIEPEAIEPLHPTPSEHQPQFDGYVSSRAEGPSASNCNCRPCSQSVVPGTGFEPVCLSAARFKFDQRLSIEVRQRSFRRRRPTRYLLRPVCTPPNCLGSVWEQQTDFHSGDLQGPSLSASVAAVAGVVADRDVTPGQRLELAVQGGSRQIRIIDGRRPMKYVLALALRGKVGQDPFPHGHEQFMSALRIHL